MGITKTQEALFKRRHAYYTMLLSLSRFNSAPYTEHEIKDKLRKLTAARYYAEFNDEDRG